MKRPLAVCAAVRSAALAWACLAAGAAAADPFCLLLDTAERDALRKAVREPGWKRDLYRTDRGSAAHAWGTGTKANAERWLARPIVVPGRAGRLHDFVCADGTPLRTPPDQLFSSDAYPCPSCRQACRGSRFDDARRYFEHHWLAAAAFDCALVSVLEDGEAHAAKAKEILLKIAARYPGRHTSMTDGGLLLQSVDEAVWIIPLALAYDMLAASGRVTPADAKALAAFFRDVAYGLRGQGTRGSSGSWHLAACGVVGFALGDVELSQWAVDAFRAQMAHQLGSDGLWPESALTCHFYALSALLHLCEAARHRGIDLYRRQAPAGNGLKSMFLRPLAYMYPDFRLPAINDGWFDSFLPLDLYEVAFERYRDDEFLWALREGYRRAEAAAAQDRAAGPSAAAAPSRAAAPWPRRGLWAFLDGEEFAADPPGPTLASANFDGLGLAALRAGNEAMLTFDYGPFLGRGHLDRMGITLWAHGRLLAADYGTPGAGVPLGEWYRKTEAHNTVVVDGKDQQKSSDVSCAVFLGDPYLELVEATTREAYPGVTHTRTVVRVDEAFVVWDRLAKAAPDAVFDWLLRGEGRLVPGFAASPPNADAAPPYRFGPRSLTAERTSPWTARWEDATGGLAVWMDASDAAPVAVGCGEAPAETDARRVWLTAARRRGLQAEFLAVLVPYQGPEAPRVRMEKGVIVVERGDATDYLALRGVTARDAPIETDGRAAAVRLGGGKAVRRAVVDGKALNLKAEGPWPAPRGRKPRE